MSYWSWAGLLLDGYQYLFQLLFILFLLPTLLYTICILVITLAMSVELVLWKTLCSYLVQWSQSLCSTYRGVHWGHSPVVCVVVVEHKRLSVKTDDILAMQEPMLYTFTMWLCYNTNTSIDPTFYNCHHQGIVWNNDALSFDALSLFVLVSYSFNTPPR